MPNLPQWRVQTIDGHGYYVLDWREAFRSDLTQPGRPDRGEMRGFHVVFRLRVEHGGKLVFMNTDGCIVRKNGEVVHEDREEHPLGRHELPIAIGDRLEVAQWQRRGDWLWGARLAPSSNGHVAEPNVFKPYWRKIDTALRSPNGPTLKVYTAARDPLRCALSIYSLILNGYRPAGIQIYGDYQWDENRRHSMRTLSPFADFVSIARVQDVLDRLDPELMPLARRQWLAMKACVCLFIPPYDYCYLDDDIFVLDRIDDALDLFGSNDLVYAPDADYDKEYRGIWCPTRATPLPTGNLNAGFYLLRNRCDIREQVARLLQTPPTRSRTFLWEQGFMACEFADVPTMPLSSQRYFYPVFDGLPGGLLGYDWYTNPCGFVTVHFGGPRPKPQYREVATLVHDILGRHKAAA